MSDSSLPVLETMQQFTLDAIEASGNTGMSDEQKFALNHFFFSVGAITGDGIWSKLKYVFLPFVGNTLDKSFVDYITNVTYVVTSAAQRTMRNGGVVAAGDSVISRPVVENAVSGLSTSNLSVVALFESDKEYNDFGNITFAGLGGVIVGASKSSVYNFISLTTSTMSNPAVRGYISKSGNQFLNGLGMSINQLDVAHFNPLFITADHSLIGATTKDAVDPNPTETTITDATLITNFAPNTSAALQALIIGEYLTPEELSTLMRAADLLKQSFCAV